MQKLHPKLVISIILFLTSFSLSFTPFYSLGYIIIVALLAYHFTFIEIFKSFFSRFIIGTLVLVTLIMVAGFIMLPTGQPLHPSLIVILTAITLAITVLLDKNNSSDRFHIIDKSDLFSIGIASLGPLLMVASFGLSAPGIFQIASEGWDNGSHLLMLQEASSEKRYLYGPRENFADIQIQDSNAYPQGWHLSTANIANGFGYPVFSPDNPIHANYFYVLTLFAWVAISAYVLAKSAWFITKKFSRHKSGSLLELALMTVSVLIVTSVVIWGALVSGFSNYIAFAAFLGALVSILVSSIYRNTPAILFLSVLMGAGAILSWFLPAPAIIAMLIIFFAINKNTLRAYKITALPLVAALSITIILAGIQAAIFIIYGTRDGAEQLNEGVAVDPVGVINGVFPVSQIFFSIVAFFTVTFWLTHKSLTRQKWIIIALTITPFAILAISLFVFQMATRGTTSYYLPKLLGLALMPITLFAIPAYTTWLEDVTAKYTNLSKIGVLATGLCLIGLVTLAGNQSLYGVSRLLEGNTRVSRPVAEEIVSYLRYANKDKTDIVILRNDRNKPYEDTNGKFEMKVLHKKFTCAFRVNRGSSQTIEMKLEILDNCAKEFKESNKNIIVVTSNETKDDVENLGHNNLIIRNIP